MFLKQISLKMNQIWLPKYLKYQECWLIVYIDLIYGVSEYFEMKCPLLTNLCFIYQLSNYQVFDLNSVMKKWKEFLYLIKVLLIVELLEKYA